VIEPWRATAFPIVKDLMVDRRRVRPHRRGRRLHHRRDRRCPRRQPDPDPEAGGRRRDGRGRLHRLRRLRGGLPQLAANLFTAAKVAHLNLLPQGQAERYSRVEAMVDTMEEFFGSCTNHGECQEACPKEISIDFIA
jgi:succinate dehydrogenase / fumarate reductase iron-sulfur subunit